MNAKSLLFSVIVSGIAILGISQIISYLVSIAFPFNILTLPGIRSTSDPLMMLFFLYPFVLAAALSFAYTQFENALNGDWKSKGMQFGFIAFILLGIPNAFLLWTSMDYPTGFMVSNLIGNFLSLMAAGYLISFASK